MAACCIPDCWWFCCSLSTFVLGDPPAMPLFFAGVVIMMAINLAVEPNSSALALEPMGEMAGIASSVYGTIFFTVGASLGSIVSGQMVSGVFPLVVAFFAIGVVAVLLAFGDSRSGKGAGYVIRDFRDTRLRDVRCYIVNKTIETHPTSRIAELVVFNRKIVPRQFSHSLLHTS